MKNIIFVGKLDDKEYVVSLDPLAQTDESGVQGIHLTDFLLSSAFCLPEETPRAILSPS